ncbi:MAG TPA: proton-conducting transporter membrane subunit [Planctomycetota bacterium]|nr:proton-conducting transporter membrane subunit [Planctomycetota bacterium]
MNVIAPPFELPHGLTAACVLGVGAAVVLAAASRLRMTTCNFVAAAVPVLAAIPIALQPSAETVPVLLVLGACLICGCLRGDDLALPHHRAEAVALQLLGSAGACVLATATDWLSLLLGFEAMSLAVAVLAGNGRHGRALEGSFRFFVVSAVSAATLVFGIAMHFAATGSFALSAPPVAGEGMQAMATAGAVLAAVGLGFELAIVPSHLATLAIVRSAPTSCVGFATLVSKVGAAFAMAKLAAAHPALQPILVWLGVATIVWAALGGLGQRTARGLIAYSAVGHAGFLALAAAGGGAAAVPFYAIVYLCSAALVLAGWNGENDAELAAGRELPLAEIARRPLHGLRRTAWVVGVVSLAGIPPAPGFLAKITVLRDTWATAGTTATAIAALASVAAALFYLRPVPELLAGPRAAASTVPFAARVAIAVAAAAGVVCALAPAFSIGAAR